jgi:hypothetical protein
MLMISIQGLMPFFIYCEFLFDKHYAKLAADEVWWLSLWGFFVPNLTSPQLLLLLLLLLFLLRGKSPAQNNCNKLVTNVHIIQLNTPHFVPPCGSA